MPVLAEKTVQGAASVEDGQVVMATAAVTRADPVSDAIGGEGVTVPVQQSTPRSPGEVAQATPLGGPHPAEAASPFRDVTASKAKHALGPHFSLRGLFRQVEKPPGALMGPRRMREGVFGASADAFQTDAHLRGDQRGMSAAQGAALILQRFALGIFHRNQSSVVDFVGQLVGNEAAALGAGKSCPGIRTCQNRFSFFQ
jgi:hypothetical protein